MRSLLLVLGGLVVGLGLGFFVGRASAPERPADDGWVLEDSGRGDPRPESREEGSPSEADGPVRPEPTSRIGGGDAERPVAPGPGSRAPRILRLSISREDASDAHDYPALITRLEAVEGKPLVVAAPLECLEGAFGAAVEVGGRHRALRRVAGRLLPAGLVLFEFDGPTSPVTLAPRAPEPGAGLEVWPLEGAALPVALSVRGFAPPDARGRLRLELDAALDGSGGGAAFDEEGRATGLVVEAGTDAARLIPLSEESSLGYERLDLDVVEFRRLFYEGTADALLAEARRHLRAERYREAIRAFRAAHEREARRVEEEAAVEWLGAHRALVARSGVGAERTRLEALVDALRDFPREAELEADAARTALVLRLYDDALVHWDRAWALDASVVGDLDAAKTAVYRTWAESLVAAGRQREAIDVIERALREVRGDAELLALYGRLLLKIRDYAGAAAALRDAIRLDPLLEDVLYELVARADRFSEGPGKVVIDYAPGARSIIAEVRINGRASGEFIIDTGATASFIPDGLAARAGLDTSDRVPRVSVRTAGNERRLPYSPCGSIAIGGLAVENIDVIVGDLPGTGQRGLLGMDFLGKFGFENDAENGRFVIYEKR
ncbi:MAG: aspartyl protease family protein [Planctomycetota bacterium]